MAKYFGYDGYFLNEEEGNLQDSRFRPFMSYLTSKGLYTQWYTNTPGTWSSSKAGLLDHGRIMNSVFLNYNWPGTQDRSVEAAKAEGYDPYQSLFFGVEANQAGFNGKHRSVTESTSRGGITAPRPPLHFSPPATCTSEVWLMWSNPRVRTRTYHSSNRIPTSGWWLSVSGCTSQE